MSRKVITALNVFKGLMHQKYREDQSDFERLNMIKMGDVGVKNKLLLLCLENRLEQYESLHH